MIKKFLRPLQKEDFRFTSDIDRIFTKLVLDDYDWMQYKLQATFPIKTDDNINLLFIELEYMGFNNSNLNLQLRNEKLQFEFPTDTFNKYLEKYMKTHMQQNIHGTYAFYGGDIMLEIYNELIETVKNQKPTEGAFDDITL